MLHACIIMLAALFPVSEDQVFSGPQPGEQLIPFTVKGALGDQLDKPLDPVALAAGKPLVLVFVHERTRPAFGLANLIMRLVTSRGTEAVHGAIIFLTDDPTETATWLTRVAQHFPKGTTVGISTDGVEGPGAYGLNRNVAVTVLIAKSSRVTANFALVQPGNAVDGPKIFRAIAEVLGEQQVPSIDDFAAPADRRMQAAKPDPSTTSEPDPKVRELLRPLIQKEATDAQVDEAAKRVEAYAAGHPKAMLEIGNIARRIIAAERLKFYGTPRCQHHLTKWSQNFVAQDAPSDKRPSSETPPPSRSPARD